MMIKYQSLVHDSTKTLFKFRDICRLAIDNHVSAIELMYQDKEFHYSDFIGNLLKNKVTENDFQK